MAFALPRTLTLPSGARVTLRRTSSAVARPRAAGAPLFSEVLALFEEGAVAMTKDGAPLDVRELPLADFHVLRAFLIKAGIAGEDEIEIDCHNCGEVLVVRPCSGLETGPWEDGELGDPELDVTAELGVPLAIEPIALGRVRQATTITLAPRTVREAMPMWTALGEDRSAFDERVALGMGLAAIGPVTGAKRLARVLGEPQSEARAAVAETFLAAHYPLRLACDVFCPKCKARNTVDAPADRELERPSEPPPALGDDAEPLPSLEEFVERAHAIADPRIAEIPGERVELVVEDGTPAVDDGGEPLLGSYVPPPPAGAPVPTRPPTITVYYRTFVRIEEEEGPFDWEAELRETIEHELEHHVYWLRGDDPMDEEEHAEIEREAARVVGQREATRRTLAGFGASLPDFVRRAWPLIVLGALSLALVLAEGRCQ